MSAHVCAYTYQNLSMGSIEFEMMLHISEDMLSSEVSAFPERAN